MELSEIQIGTKLELELFDEEGERLEQTLVSEFEWLEGENLAAIAAPIFEGHIVPLPIYSKLCVYFIKRIGSLPNLYRFNAIIQSRSVIDNLHILIVEKQGDILKVQRRNYFRLDCFVEVRYRIIDPEGNDTQDRDKDTDRGRDKNEDKTFINTLANNLSGGGVCLLLEEKLPAGTIIECEMFGDTTRKVRFYGKVVRFEETGKDGKYKKQGSCVRNQVFRNKNCRYEN